VNSRDRILRAAIEEFGERGYAGARTASIAARAGVNAQLITYHFGGKQGLLEELRRQWTARQQEATAAFAASFAAHLDLTLDQPDWAKLVLWQALGDGDRSATASIERQRERIADAVDSVRRRQRDGELTEAVEPRFVVLLSYALAFAPISMPHVVDALFGHDPGHREYRRRCQEQLLTLIKGDDDE
jgi:AcrR family transcriptional regulator